MIRHLVIIYFDKTKKIDAEKGLKKTPPLVRQIKGVLDYKIYNNLSHYTPDNCFSLGVEILFEDQSALEAFMTHPLHKEANQLFEHYMIPPSFAALTYEC